MQSVPCLVCTSNKATPVYRLVRDPYLRRIGLEGSPVLKVMCQGCGLVYSSPQLEPQELKRIYENLRVSPTPSPEHLWWKQKQAQEDYEWVAPHLSLPGSVFDIGCSEGSLLMEFHRRGWQTSGIEPSAYAQYGQKVYGLDVRQGTLEEEALTPVRFDLVCALRVMEHLHDPRLFLSQVKRLLKDQGKLYLEVPNAWRPRHHPAEFLGAQHLRLFTRDSLVRFLRQEGWRALVVDDQGRGLRLLAQLQTPGAFPEILEEPGREYLSQARALRRVLWNYRVSYFFHSTLKSGTRRAMDRWMGPQRARKIVGFGKQLLKVTR